MNNKNKTAPTQKNLTKRSLSFGLNTAFITIVVLGIVGVLNFLSFQYPKKFDTTKNKLHTFSDQSEKVMKGLNDTLNATFYGDINSKEKYRSVFENYKKLSNKFVFELVDPAKELIRTKQAGIKHPDTLVLTYKGKTQKVESISEETITNAIIKLNRDVKIVVCNIQGHGEQSITGQTAESYSSVKKGLEDQGYETKEFNLLQENKIPDDCTAILLLGPTKALFAKEIEILSNYFNNGGRAVVTLEASITQLDQQKELKEILKSWGIEAKNGLIVDLRSRMQGGDASVPINVMYNSNQTITKDSRVPTYFPFARPIDATAQAPEGVKVEWLTKTSQESWNELDMAAIAKGAVQFSPDVDTQGPINTGLVSSGKKKDSKATRETRIVVFGSAQFANNQYSRFGGNLDLFLNATSWALEDENLISIRAKEEGTSKLEIIPLHVTIIFWVSVVFVPLLIAIVGIIIWVRRKKL